MRKNFSTGYWLKIVLKKIKEIQKRNKIPVLVGGTGLYFKALTAGLVTIPKIPKKFPCRDFSGDDNPLRANIKRTPEIKYNDAAKFGVII